MVGIVIFVIAVASYTFVAAAVDLRMHRIPNYVTVPAAGLGLVYHCLAPTGMGPLMSLAGFGLGFALLLLPALCGGGGMGDVKLLAALGAWLGPVWLLVAFAAAVLIAAILAIGIVILSVMERGMIRTGRKYFAAKRPMDKSGKKRAARVLPFAAPIALSTWVILAWIVMSGSI